MFIKKYRELIKSISHHINPESIPVFVEYLDTHILEVFDCIKLLAEYELKEEEISTLYHAGMAGSRMNYKDSIHHCNLMRQEALDRLNETISVVNDMCEKYDVEQLFPNPEEEG